MSKLGEAMQEGMEATVGAMAPIFAAQMIQASAESIRAFLQAAESASGVGQESRLYGTVRGADRTS